MRIVIELLNGIRLESESLLDGEEKNLVENIHEVARDVNAAVVLIRESGETYIPSRNIAYIVLKKDK